MNSDCRWLERNLEGFFCDRLSAEEASQVRVHLENCPECEKAIHEFQALDPLVRQVFEHNLAVARAPRKPVESRRWAPIYTAAAALIAVVIWAGLRNPETPVMPVTRPTETIAAVPAPSTPEAAPIVKGEGTPVVERAKPQPAPATAPAARPRPDRMAEPDASEKRQPFLVSDAAGYSRTLSDYRNHILIFGVWSAKDPQAIGMLQRLYETYGANPKVRILGVSNERMSKPANGTFPVVYNENSQLLGAQTSDVVIVDGTGAVRFRGSLLGNPNAVSKTVHSALEPLGIR